MAARVRPLWKPGSAHGYHGITIGVIATELIRRVTGATFADFYRQRVQQAAGTDLYFGIAQQDTAQAARIIDVRPPALRPGETLQGVGLQPEPDTLVGLSVNSFPSFPTIAATANDWRIREAGPAAIGGLGSARGLAQLYAACLGSPESEPLVSAETIETMTQIHASGKDLVLEVQNRFGLIFQNADSRLDYGSPWAFGHDGVGGSIGFADPTYELSFGYVTSRIPVPGGADGHGIALARTIRQCLRSMRR